MKSLLASALIHFSLLGIFFSKMSWNFSSEEKPITMELDFGEVKTRSSSGLAPTKKAKAPRQKRISNPEQKKELAQDEMSSGEGEKSNSENSQNDQDRVYEEGSLSRRPRLRGDFEIPYPRKAKEANIQGSVKIEVIISDLGQIKSLRLIQGVHPFLNEPVLEAVKNLKFYPAELEGKKVTSRIVLAFDFEVEDD